MKNNKIIYLIIFYLFFCFGYLKANEQFSFDVTKVEISDNGNLFKGLNRGIAKTNNEQLIIIADFFEYNKITNILIAKGNVIVEDKVKNYILESNHLTYFKTKEKIFSKDKTKILIESKYNIKSSDLELDRIENIITSNKKSIILDDDYSKYETDILHYSIDNKLFKGSNILISTNINKDNNEKEFYNFEKGIFNLEEKDFIAAETKIHVKKNIFDQSENDPRILGVYSKKQGVVTTVNKAIFTSCKQTGNCPPWSIKAETIKHDQDKKNIIYENPILQVYDFPVFYFPKFSHPDPTVIRRSGFLQPQLNNSNLTGSSLLIPYFHVLSENRDFTFKPSIFDSNIYMYQGEYRQENENSKFIADLGVTKGYQAPGEKRNSIGHLFAKFTSDLKLDDFVSSSLDMSFQKSTKDTFLKVFEPNFINMNQKIKPNASQLKSDVNLHLDNENFNLTSGFVAYENLNGLNSDRYQYVLPYYNFSRQLYQNTLLNFNFSSSGNNNLKETNKLESTISNNLDINSIDFFSKTGLKSNFQLYFKNLNSVGKNINTLKSSPDVQLYNIVNLETSLPLIKYSDNFSDTITPRMSFRINPADMNDASSSNRTIDANNIFDIDRLALSDFEQGKSLTLGLDYKKESIENINKYFEFKLAGVLRDVDQKNIPTSSSLNQTASNLFGAINYSLSDNIDFGYDFAVDNDFNTLERNSLRLGLSFMDTENNQNKFNTNFSYTETNGKIGDTNIWSNSTTFNFDENNLITFETRRNRKINFTEYYNLVYEYKNDCLVAGIKFNKSFYQDRDLKPKEELLLTITFFPITQYDQKIND